MARLGMAGVVLALALPVQAFTWDVEYSGNVNPWSASPAWSGTNGGSPLPAWGPAVTNVADPYFIIDTTVNNSQSEYFTINAASGNWNPDFAGTGMVYEVKARVFETTNLGHSIYVGDGANYLAMQFWDTGQGLNLRINNVWTGVVVEPAGVDDWHTYQIVITGTAFDLFVDGSVTPNYSSSLAAGGSSETRWGDQTSGGDGLVHYSEIRYANVPEPAALMLLASGGLLALRRRGH